LTIQPKELSLLLLAVGLAGIDMATHPTHETSLRHRPATIPPDLAARLRLYKPEVLAILRGEGLPDETEGDSEAAYIMGERLGIADELGMPTHPGSPAWLVAVGEAMTPRCTLTPSVVY
jgi:hypothetical protein